MSNLWQYGILAMSMKQGSDSWKHKTGIFCQSKTGSYLCLYTETAVTSNNYQYLYGYRYWVDIFYTIFSESDFGLDIYGPKSI